MCGLQYHHGLFLRTLRPAGGGFVATVTFLPTAPTPISFLFAVAAGAFFPPFTIVVPVEASDILLVLLTFRTSSGSSAPLTPRFVRVAGRFAAVFEAETLRPPPVRGRPALGFSLIMLARLAVAAAAAALAGDVPFMGEIAFSGDTG